MILLSENNSHRYYGVPLPKDANRIDRQRTNEGQYYLAYSVPFSGNNWHENKFIKVGEKQKIEIIGVLGKGSEISEEVAEEIVTAYRSHYSTFSFEERQLESLGLIKKTTLKSIIKSKGILIENPIEYPIDVYYTPEYGSQKYPQECYSSDLEQWQSYEDKLQKVVLIKVKK